eukprot:TRINITY_DN5428_c0_g1_i1.p3 TRINITY_DN5428_c0_g1~~TRINITY_DN5428_c0_g1_i1.p3  ORF type:complete len:149 (+),score=27.05 TRINITY_DN5428_c0_g1_i1:660-1106(+)
MRAITHDDVEEVIDIEHESFTDPYSDDFFYQMVYCNLVYAGIIVGERCDNHKLAGYVAVQIRKRKMEIVSIGVSVHSRRAGVGVQLMEEAISFARSRNVETVKLHVSSVNMPAQKLYLKLGFVQKKWLTNYYSNVNEDAILMEKRLQL